MSQSVSETMMRPAEMIEMLTFKVPSDLPISLIAERVPAACEKNKFSILQTFDYYEILERKGFPITRKVFIYEVCQAKIASKMLTTHPEFSIFMPCKISLYEEEGSTFLSTLNMAPALKALEEDRELFEAASEMFRTLQSLMHSLAEGK